ncbi:MAG: oligosaccharide flippase family protein, partial [Chloroflexota bacterium]
MAGFLLLPLLLYGPVTVGGRTMLPADNLFQWQPWAGAAADLGVEVPHNSLVSDLILENYAWKRFIQDSLQAREIPLWNPYLFAGAPFLANGQHSAYYPFSLLFLVLPLAKAYGWYTVSQLWLAGALAYFFGRVLGLRRGGAAVVGLVYQGSGFMVVSAAVFPMIIGAAAWLPLLLACIERVIRHSTGTNGGRTLPWVVLGAVALGCQVLAGHVEITYYTLLVMAFYALWELLRQVASSKWQVQNPKSKIQNLKSAAWLLALVAAGLTLGAIQLIPLAEVLPANFREGSATLAEVRSWAYPPRHALALLMPNFYGNPTHHDYVDVFTGGRVPFTTNYSGEVNPHGAYSSDWGIKNYVEGGIYLGVLPLLLAGLGVGAIVAGGRWQVAGRSASRRLASSSKIQNPKSKIEQVAGGRWPGGFFLVLSLLCLAFMFGTPLYALLYYGLPGINQLHSPFRWVFPFSLCVAVLAGVGLDYGVAGGRRAEEQRSRGAGEQVASGKSKIQNPKSKIEGVAGGRGQVAGGRWQVARFTLLAGLLILLGLALSSLFYGRLEPFVERIFLALALAPDAFPDARAFYSYEFRQVLILGLMVTAAGLLLRYLPLATARKRQASGLRYPRHLPPALLAYLLIILDLFLAGRGFNAAVDPALLDYKPALVEWLEQQPGLWRLTTFTPHGDKPLNANTSWLYDLQDVRGYDSIILKQYTEYMAAIEPQNELAYNRVQPVANWESLNSPLLDLLGVKYVITAETLALPKLRLAWEGEGLRVYENLAVAARAFTLPQTATAVVPNPLAAMRELDPRQYVILGEGKEGTEGTEGTRVPLVPLVPPVSSSLRPAEVVHYSNLEVQVETTVNEPSWLVLNDTYFTGWQAYRRPAGEGEEEEQEIPIYRVNGNFRGVLLAAGSWSVRFRYSPLSFKLGGLVSLLSGLTVLFVTAVWLWRRFYNPQARLTNTRSIAKNSLIPMGLNLFNRLIDFIFAAFYLRLLGPADAGRYATAIAIAGWFEIVSNFGLNTLVIREVAQDRSQAGRYLLNTSLLRLGTTILGALPVVLYVAGVGLAGNPLDTETVAAILLICLGMVFSGLGQGVAGLFYAFEAAEGPAAVATVTTLMKVGLGVIALLLGYGFVGLAAVSIVVNVITLVVLGVAAFRLLQAPSPPPSSPSEGEGT